jgi:hypothetical protein
MSKDMTKPAARVTTQGMKKKSKAHVGRPTVGAVARNKVLTIRATPGELAAWAMAAQASHLSISDYIRDLARAAIAKGGPRAAAIVLSKQLAA